jgi:glycosyltransferase involved in cell wall biosynthesis
VRIWGAMIVRDAVDLVGVCLRHHVALGLERVVVVDNGSTDGTWECVRDLSRRLPIDVRRDDGPYRQAEMVNAAVQEAAAGGADWVMPIDVDEFFVAPRGLATVLGETDAAVVEVGVVNFVQRRSRTTATPRGLLTMDRRPEVPLAPLRAQPLVEAGRRALVEIEWDPSIIVRPSPGLWIEKGSHRASNAEGAIERTVDMTVLHAPLRARDVLESRLEHGRRLEEAGEPPSYGWHLRQLPTDRHGLAELWAANSSDRGALDVAGVRRPLVRDRRLAEAVAPHLPSRLGALRRWARAVDPRANPS